MKKVKISKEAYEKKVTRFVLCIRKIDELKGLIDDYGFESNEINSHLAGLTDTLARKVGKQFVNDVLIENFSDKGA